MELEGAPEEGVAVAPAGHAVDLGLHVFAIPGRMDDWRCVGSNRLLRDGAGVVTDVWDILCHYVQQYPHKIREVRQEGARQFGGGAEVRKAPPKAKPKPEPKLPELDLSQDHGMPEDQIQVLRALQSRSMQMDDIIDQTQLPAQRVSSALTMLEIDQRVTVESGKRFCLTVTLKN